jgi:hypothetical protein
VRRFYPDDEILDAPVDIRGWRPENYGRHYHGEVTLAKAFANSLNDATVRPSQKVGVGQVIAAARDLGLRAPLENNPSLALGTGEVTLLDLTSAYAAVRAGKAPVDPWGISGVMMPNDSQYLPIGHPDDRAAFAGPVRQRNSKPLKAARERSPMEELAMESLLLPRESPQPKVGAPLSGHQIGLADARYLFRVNFFRSSAAILSASSCAFLMCLGAVTTVGRQPSIASGRTDTKTPPITSL